jgi:hypothetical protein
MKRFSIQKERKYFEDSEQFSEVVFFLFCFVLLCLESKFCYVVQADCKLLGASNPSASAS